MVTRNPIAGRQRHSLRVGARPEPLDVLDHLGFEMRLTDQVEMGVAVRIAVLQALARHLPNE